MVTKRISIGGLNIETLPPKVAGVLPENDPAPYLYALDVLRGRLEPGTWSLAGGLVVPIAVGCFYRKHTDIDIVMPRDLLMNVVDRLRGYGYELYTSWNVTHHSRGVMLECRVKPEGALLRVRPRHLYVKSVARKPGSPLLYKIDLYPFHDRGAYLETCNSKRVLSKRNMQYSCLDSFNRPGYVSCLHIDNVASLKSTRSGAKHKLDCAVIRGGPDAAREWFCRLPGAAARAVDPARAISRQ